MLAHFCCLPAVFNRYIQIDCKFKNLGILLEKAILKICFITALMTSYIQEVNKKIYVNAIASCIFLQGLQKHLSQFWNARSALNQKGLDYW